MRQGLSINVHGWCVRRIGSSRLLRLREGRLARIHSSCPFDVLRIANHKMSQQRLLCSNIVTQQSLTDCRCVQQTGRRRWGKLHSIDVAHFKLGSRHRLGCRSARHLSRLAVCKNWHRSPSSVFRRGLDSVSSHLFSHALFRFTLARKAARCVWR